MAKLNRERGLTEKRAAKEARKAARRRAAENGEPLLGLSDLPPETADEAADEAARIFERSQHGNRM
ncbi:MAG TPA: hypothetical protein VF066_09085 [Thermoleophilaceae bacterium]